MKSVVIVMLLLLGACGFTGAEVTRDEMNKRASELTKLSAAMESYIRYGDPVPGASEDELLKAATKDQPQLLGGFSDFKLRVLFQDRHSAVLVCTKSGDRALLEDAGCTGKMEVHHWEKKDAPCSFTVSIPKVCGLK
jgi:hypothetical protein